MIIVLRRLAAALGAAGLLVVLVRLRDRSETPPRQNSWRELSGPGLR